MSANRAIPFNLTRPQYLELKAEIDAAVQQVLEDSWFILGKQGIAFEEEFATYLGARGTPSASARGRRPSTSPCGPSASAPATR